MKNFMINFIKINILILIFFQNLNAQTFFSSNPNDILYLEQKSTLDSSYSNNLMVRPILNPSINNEWSLLARAELYFNTNYPNFENMGNRYIGKGFGAFNSLNLSYHGKFLSFSIEPFYIYNQNKNNNLIEKDGMFARLNDAGYNIASPYESIGLRETQLYLHYKSLAIGYSNANMWWGPGIHNTLTMTNNTSGFSHLMIGTINEKRFKNLGFNIRYVFSTLDKTIGNPYFTGLVWNFKIYSNPIISFGLIRNYLSGGLPTDRPFT